MPRFISSGNHHRDACGFGLIADLKAPANRSLVSEALEALARLTHRGALAADGQSGDGCGLLLGLPDHFFRSLLRSETSHDPAPQDRLIVAHFMTDDDVEQVARALHGFAPDEEFVLRHVRETPVDASALGQHARASLPRHGQAIWSVSRQFSALRLEAMLYGWRRRFEREKSSALSAYVASLSARTIAYRALVRPESLSQFFLDLQSPELKSRIAVFHQRFSTNTRPAWRLAQPFRCLAHNGEINTIAGNRSWTRVRAACFPTDLSPPGMLAEDSDSASLDQIIEFLCNAGWSPSRAIRTLVPPAWHNVPHMAPDIRAMYQIMALESEPWDGPAAVVFTNGEEGICALDRNGLRPARMQRRSDGRVVIASETGVVDWPAERILEQSKLGPGDIVRLRLSSGEISRREQLERELLSGRDLHRWRRLHRTLNEIDQPAPLAIETSVDDTETEPRLQIAGETLSHLEFLFGVSFEEREKVLLPLVAEGKEAIGSMGDDAPIAAIAPRSRSLFDFFRQQFAQVTNPPMDPLREQLVMSLEVHLGCLQATAGGPVDALTLESPLLSAHKFEVLQNWAKTRGGFACIELLRAPEESLVEALARLRAQAIDAIGKGALILSLDDRAMVDSARRTARVPIPALLAVADLRAALEENELATRASIVVASASARDPHQIACLLGFGASAVYPWLAYAVCLDLAERHGLRASLNAEDNRASIERTYRLGINLALYKILSKVGISTLPSYIGARCFEGLGLASEVMERSFVHTPYWRVGRFGYSQLEKLGEERWRKANALAGQRKVQLIDGRFKAIVSGEPHAWNPPVVQALRLAARSGRQEDYDRFAELVDRRAPLSIRDYLAPREAAAASALDAVEPVQAIMPRFESAGMSLGALSPEAHEALAMGMNAIGGRSNSGEGGEDPARYGTDRRSRIKQVASGRFGVTPAYLGSAEVIQIKIAQGAKPGEGGQLPGHKVDAKIAALRFADPGIGLISPPPHHDIYSIEDLAQLIYDLKEINPEALVSVKLVARVGIGAIAAGVAKAHADLITISGHDGGTGASPLSSIKHAGSPWELGLAEVQQTLVAEGLRGRVRLQADGGLKTGLDVIKAAALGADSYGFGTAPMVALGCKYLRICHLNNCATGVATQHERLRHEHFRGLADHVSHYFRALAEDVRRHLARLGVHSLEEIVGRNELLAIREDVEQPLDLRRLVEPSRARGSRRSEGIRNTRQVVSTLAETMLEECRTAIEAGRPQERSYRISNDQRTIGARLSWLATRCHGSEGLRKTPTRILLEGHAGQSLAAWNAPGIHIVLTGTANDYVAKGMAGGLVVLKPPVRRRYVAEESHIAGNVCLYGATGGRFFADGRVGERFAVRNSGALAVVDGCGDHGCEYMTRGAIAVLGPAGLNFGAGMTGGIAFVYDEHEIFHDQINRDSVDVIRIDTEAGEPQARYLRSMLAAHRDWTQSSLSARMLEDFRSHLPRFWLVKPKAANLEALLDRVTQAA